jgi:hypothetical protein
VGDLRRAGEITQAVFKHYKKPNHLENTSLPSKPLTPTVTAHGNVKKKREHRRGSNKIRQTAHPPHQAICICLRSNSNDTGARLNLSNGGEGKGPRDDITTHSMLIRDDNNDTHVDLEPQIALF